jgi:hypothetical protein
VALVRLLAREVAGRHVDIIPVRKYRGWGLMTQYSYRFLENALIASRVVGALRKLSSKSMESK